MLLELLNMVYGIRKSRILGLVAGARQTAPESTTSCEVCGDSNQADDEAEEIRAHRNAEIERYYKLKESAGECKCGHDFDEERLW